MNPNLKTYKKTKKVFNRTFFFTVLFLALYICLFLVVKNSVNQTVSLQAETKILQAQESEIGQLKQNLATTEESQKVLTSYFIDSNNIVPFLETIEGYGRTTNVKTNFDKFEVKKTPNRLDVSLSANGSFSDLYHFIYLLEAAPYEISISNAQIQLSVPIGLQPAGTGVHSNGWEAHILLSVSSITGVK